MNYIFYLCLLVCAGCALKVPVRQDTFQNKEIIAKYADLPDVPFQAKLQSIAINPDDHHQIQMLYSTMMSVQELADFYQQQMERCGWELLAESHAQDWLLHYVKPQQVCSILISDNKLTIYLGNKKGA